MKDPINKDNFNRRLVAAMRRDDIEDIDQAATFLRWQGLNYEAVRARFNLARVEAGMVALTASEFEDLMQRLDELP